MQLSEHFTLAEATRSETARQHRPPIDNTPPPDVIERMRAVCEAILEPVRKHYGVPVSINSFYRCLELNRCIKSKDNSQHVLGEAVDFEVFEVPNAEVAAWVRDNLTFDQCIIEFARTDDPFAGWVHVSYKADEAACRNQCLTINETGTFDGLLT